MPGRILSGVLPGSGATRTFDLHGEFAATYAAETYLRERGFSIGKIQAGAPRGIVFDPNLLIAKWRKLRPIERAGLHGELTGDPRNGPITVALFETAPPAAFAALRSPIPTHDRGLNAFRHSADVAAVATLVFVLGVIVYVGWSPIWSRPHRPMTADIVVKHTNRAGVIGLRAAAHSTQATAEDR